MSTNRVATRRILTWLLGEVAHSQYRPGHEQEQEQHDGGQQGDRVLRGPNCYVHDIRSFGRVSGSASICSLLLVSYQFSSEVIFKDL